MFTHLLPMVGGFNIDTASYDNKSFDTSVEDNDQLRLRIAADGNNIYVIGGGFNKIYQYGMSTAYDVSTASYTSKSFTVGTASEGFFIRQDGKKLFVVDRIAQEIWQYSIGTPWDISTAFDDGVSLDISTTPGDSDDIFFDPTGAKMYLFCASSCGYRIFEFILSTPWNVSTANAVGNFLVRDVNDQANGIAFSLDGSKLFVCGFESGKRGVHQFNLTTRWQVQTAKYNNQFLDTSTEETIPLGIDFNLVGNKLYMIGPVNLTIFQYALT